MAYNYVDNPNPNLVCCICRAPFVNPYTTRTCSHTFCRDCILTALEVTPQCPIDRSPLRGDNLSPADVVLRNLVDELLVECPNRSEGCQESCQRQLVDAHLRDDCSYAEVSCFEDKCDRRHHRKDAQRHSHKEGTLNAIVDGDSEETSNFDCLKKTTTCAACLSEVPAPTLLAHTEVCPDAIVSCTHAANGCPWSGRRSILSSTHIPTCPYEAIKGFFAVTNDKMSAMAQENAQLRHHISALQGMVSIFQRELHFVKSVLGPWYRPNGVNEHDVPDVMYSLDVRYAESPESATNENAAHLAPPNADLSFASYFPPEDGNVGHSSTEISRLPFPASVRPSQTQLPRVPPMATGSFIPPPGSQPAPPPVGLALTATGSSGGSNHNNNSNSSSNVSSVAPLNLSTTLHGTLSSLHTSVVSVASALDSLGRRQDVALTTEAMRMGEEVRSLRAVVNGLRMQVHAIMVDRNSQVTGGRATEGPTMSAPTMSYLGMHLPRPFPPYPTTVPPPAPPGPVTKL